MHSVNPKSLKNLRRPAIGEKPRNRDGSPAVSPGRPPTAGLAEMIRRDYERNPQAIVDILKKRKPETYAAYLAGKPAEIVQLGGIPGQPIQVEDITAGMTIPEMKARLADFRLKSQDRESNGAAS